MNWLKNVLKSNPNVACPTHGIVNCPTCFVLESDRIIKIVEEETKDLKPVEKKKDDTKYST